MNKYELIYEYYSNILDVVKTRAEKYEKTIYHELRELNGLNKIKIKKDDNGWKEDLRDLLSLDGYQIGWEDIEGAASEEILHNIQNILVNSGYSDNLIGDIGIKKLASYISDKKFDNGKLISNAQLEGLKKELITSIKRYVWAKDIDITALFYNTDKFGGGLSAANADIIIKFPKVNNRKVFRSEVKNYLDIFHIGNLPKNDIDPILRTIYFELDKSKNQILIHINGNIVQECCDRFLLNKFNDSFPIMEDGKHIILFSEFIDSMKNTKLNLRNEGEKILEPIFLNENQIDNNDELKDIALTKKKIVTGLRNPKFGLWYGRHN